MEGRKDIQCVALENCAQKKREKNLNNERKLKKSDGTMEKSAAKKRRKIERFVYRSELKLEFPTLIFEKVKSVEAFDLFLLTNKRNFRP